MYIFQLFFCKSHSNLDELEPENVRKNRKISKSRENGMGNILRLGEFWENGGENINNNWTKNGKIMKNQRWQKIQKRAKNWAKESKKNEEDNFEEKKTGGNRKIPE